MASPAIVGTGHPKRTSYEKCSNRHYSPLLDETLDTMVDTMEVLVELPERMSVHLHISIAATIRRLPGRN